MIRRAYVTLGTSVLFVIGNDKALKRFVAMSQGRPLNPAPPRPAPYTAEWRKLPLAQRRRCL